MCLPMDGKFLPQKGRDQGHVIPFVCAFEYACMYCMCICMQVCQIVLLCLGTLAIKKLTAVLLNVTDDVRFLIDNCCHKIVSCL